MDTWLNKRVIDVLTAIRERHLKMSQALKCDGSTTSDVTWITVKGTHIPLDESGTALAGGKLAGRNFGGGKSSSSAPHRNSSAPSISSTMRPKNTEYSFNPASDDMEDFVSNNVDKLMGIYKSGKMPAVHEEFYKYRLANPNGRISTGNHRGARTSRDSIPSCDSIPVYREFEPRTSCWHFQISDGR